MKRSLWFCVPALLGLLSCSPSLEGKADAPAGQDAASLPASQAPSSQAPQRVLGSDVLGTDANGDGLRDDVEAWIRGEWQGDQVRSLLNLARLKQATLSLALPQPDGLPGGAGERFTAYFNANICASEFLADAALEDFVGALEMRLINTDDRARASVRASAQASGMAFGLDDSVCERGVPRN